ncbi:MAG: hypothetical protein IJS60_04555 [Abditibacteriota bacterium]|nr:hypothetical protein [Abditibacteriota bacterium]
MKKTLLILMLFLLSLNLFAAKSILSGMNDLLITSSLGYDRNPCFLEWYQFDQNWKYFDSKVIRSTNETWIGTVAGDINQDGYIDFLTSLDNNRGYSHVRTYPLDRYASIRENATIYDNLPNEAWRHISGVEYADVTGNGENDLLIIGNDKQGNRHISAIFYKDGHIVGEEELCDVPAEAYNMALYNNVIYVTCPDQKKIITTIMAYTFDKGFNLKKKAQIATFKKDKGKITGITVREEKGKLVVVLCGHNWDAFESEEGEKDKGVSSAQDTYFLLPSVDLATTTSFLQKGEIKGDKILNLKNIEEIKGRRWQDVTFVKDFTPKSIEIPITVSPTKNCLHIMGLFSNYYHFDKYFSSIDKWYVKVEAQTESLIKSGDFSQIGNYKYVVVNDVPIYALGEEGLVALISYANAGGVVIFCNGLMSGATGGFKESDFMETLGLSLYRSSKVEMRDNVTYIKGTTLSENSNTSVLDQKGDEILFSVTNMGGGKIYYIGITPNTEDLTDFQRTLDTYMKTIMGSTEISLNRTKNFFSDI